MALVSFASFFSSFSNCFSSLCSSFSTFFSAFSSFLTSSLIAFSSAFSSFLISFFSSCSSFRPRIAPKILPRLRDRERSLVLVLLSSSEEPLRALASTGNAPSWTLPSVLFFGLDKDPVAAAVEAGAAASADGLPVDHKYIFIRSGVFWSVQLTKLLNLVLVSFTTNQSFTCRFSFGRTSLDSYQPSISLDLCRSLKAMFTTVYFERKIIEIPFGDLRYISLGWDKVVSHNSRYVSVNL